MGKTVDQIARFAAAVPPGETIRAVAPARGERWPGPDMALLIAPGLAFQLLGRSFDAGPIATVGAVVELVAAVLLGFSAAQRRRRWYPGPRGDAAALNARPPVLVVSDRSVRLATGSKVPATVAPELHGLATVEVDGDRWLRLTFVDGSRARLRLTNASDGQEAEVAALASAALRRPVTTVT